MILQSVEIDSVGSVVEVAELEIWERKSPYPFLVYQDHHLVDECSTLQKAFDIVFALARTKDILREVIK